MTKRIAAATALLLALVIPGLAFGHAERPTLSPAREGSIPDPTRTPTTIIDVCKVPGCPFSHIQAAVFAAPEGALIRIWPGLYKEEPSRDEPFLDPDNADGTYSYQHHIDHPNSQNLIAIVGKKNLTLRGMGAKPQDVVIDVEFTKHVGIRGDRADGLILENFSMYHAYDHGIYVLDQSGYLIDRVISGYSRDYGFLMFATDHGLLRNCEAFGAGDAGIYPGGAANTPGRYSNEIANCKSYHNVIGYSGTHGNYVWVHDSEFFDNATGMTSDSETDHPNYPQEHLVVERSKFHANNFNVYAADSDVFSVFGDGLYIPVGTGILLASGNDNVIQNNDIWGNDRYGVWLGTGQGIVVGPTSDPPAGPFVSTNNRFIANRMYAPAGFEGGANAIDFAWDGGGTNNCWEDNVSSAAGDPVTSDAPILPPCDIPTTELTMPLTVGVPWLPNSLAQAGLLFFEGQPVACVIDLGGCVWGPGPAKGNAKNLPPADGGTTNRSYVPNPPPCGPSGPDACPTASSSSVRGARFTRTFSATAVALPATGVGTGTASAIALIAAAGASVGFLRRRR